jgi:hypothetical protein
MTSCHPANLPSGNPAILSPCHLCQPVILPSSHFAITIKMKFLKLFDFDAILISKYCAESYKGEEQNTKVGLFPLSR